MSRKVKNITILLLVTFLCVTLITLTGCANNSAQTMQEGMETPNGTLQTQVQGSIATEDSQQGELQVSSIIQEFDERNYDVEFTEDSNGQSNDDDYLNNEEEFRMIYMED